jgi:hypothetical protein
MYESGELSELLGSGDSAGVDAHEPLEAPATPNGGFTPVENRLG